MRIPIHIDIKNNVKWILIFNKLSNTGCKRTEYIGGIESDTRSVLVAGKTEPRQV